MRVLLLPLLFLAIQVLAQAAPLNDTGQTQCFDAATSGVAECTEANTGDASSHPRQDGRFGRDAQAGAGELTKTGSGEAGFDFTKIANNGFELPPSATLGSGPNDWACTRDNVTGLVWEVKTTDEELRHNGWRYPWGSSTVGFDCGRTLSCNTENLVAAVNTAQLCGSTDWRLPTRRELLSIVYHGAASSPRIDTTFFPNTVANGYWSSDSYGPDPDFDPGFAWVSSDGYTTPNIQTSDHHVRLVRGEPITIPSPFVDNDDGTVTDLATGLMWDRCSWGQTWDGADACNGSASRHTWEAALGIAVTANALNPNHRGHSDWRLPNLTELESLVDLSTFLPAINTTAFPSTPPGVKPFSAEVFWSSTIFVHPIPGSYGAWGVFSADGSTLAGNLGLEHDGHVRLVRSGQSFDALAPVGPLAVGVDVRPWADPNWIVLFGRPGTLPRAVGVLPVAILSSETFNAVEINPAIVEIGDPALAGVLSRQLWRHRYVDANGDGRDDLVLYFRLNAMVAAGALGYDTRELRVRAETWDGVAVEGSDRVLVTRIRGRFAR